MPKSIRKFIRLEKARIRRDVLSVKEQNNKIEDIYAKFSKETIKESKKNENSRNLQPSNK